ncbi:protein kinase domain-containing protein [Ditylenchus destructor]|nr:protein kinase domain-containing protein [Ditylenchus destructor]
MPKIQKNCQLLTEGPNKVVLGGIYSIDKHIGSGAFSDIYLVRRLRDREMFAMKAEWHKRSKPQIEHEKRVYEELKGHTAIPRIHYFNLLKEHKCLVMEFLGPSLEDLLERCGGTFQMKTVLMIAAQMLSIIEYVHAKGYIHRDLKPANFCLRRFSEQQLVLIDFGLAQRYPRDENGNGNSEVDGGFKFWHPTSSARAHMGFPQDRSIDYTYLKLLFFALLCQLNFENDGIYDWMLLPKRNGVAA